MSAWKISSLSIKICIMGWRWCCLSRDWKLSIILGLMSLIPCQEMFIKHSALHRDFTLIWDCLLFVCCLLFPFIFLSSKKQSNYWKSTGKLWYFIILIVKDTEKHPGRMYGLIFLPSDTSASLCILARDWLHFPKQKLHKMKG